VVYRRELLPVITTGAEIMDELFEEARSQCPSSAPSPTSPKSFRIRITIARYAARGDPETSVNLEPRQIRASDAVPLVPGASDEPSGDSPGQRQPSPDVLRRSHHLDLCRSDPDATWPDEPSLSATETDSGRNRGTSGSSEASSWIPTGQRDASILVRRKIPAASGMLAGPDHLVSHLTLKSVPWAVRRAFVRAKSWLLPLDAGEMQDLGFVKRRSTMSNTFRAGSPSRRRR
jgi:hypothetical protein